MRSSLGFYFHRRDQEFPEERVEKAMKGEVTPNCRQQCSGCGAGAYKGGVCVEGKN